LGSLAIGNEVDGFLGGDSARWSQYQAFYKAIGAYARTKRPGLKVGVVAQFGGLTGAARVRLQALNQSSDVVMATYSR